MAEREQEVALARDGDVVGDGSDKGSDHTELSPVLVRPIPVTEKKKKKNLLVLSFSGLLVHKVQKGDMRKTPKDRAPDALFLTSLYFKRPFFDEFMRFCLDRFHVGIWSSDPKRNVDAVLSMIFEDSRDKLLFVMGQEACTSSEGDTYESQQNPLYFKDLDAVFNSVSTDAVPFKLSCKNTVLVEPNSYKALFNPLGTGIYPAVYDPLSEEEDTFLDPKGDFCAYLDELKDVSDLQGYLRRFPFGEPRIGPSHPEWSTYAEAIEGMKKPSLLKSLANYFYSFFN